MKCSECLLKNVEIVELVNNKCPKCGTEYVAPEVFSIPITRKKIVRRK